MTPKLPLVAGCFTVKCRQQGMQQQPGEPSAESQGATEASQSTAQTNGRETEGGIHISEENGDRSEENGDTNGENDDNGKDPFIFLPSPPDSRQQTADPEPAASHNPTAHEEQALNAFEDTLNDEELRLLRADAFGPIQQHRTPPRETGAPTEHGDSLRGDSRSPEAESTITVAPATAGPASPVIHAQRPRRSGTRQVDYNALHHGRPRRKRSQQAPEDPKTGSFAVISLLGTSEYNEPDDVNWSALSSKPQYCLSTLKITKMTNPPDIPKNFRAASKSTQYRDKWRPAMQKQVDSLHSMSAWELVKPPQAANILPGKWVFDEKHPDIGDSYAKARWVVCGNREAGDHYSIEDLYAAVANTTSVRIFMSLAAIHDLEVRQLDISTAFLHAEARKLVYVQQLQGFDDGSGRVCLLKKALYGLREAPLWWYITASEELSKMGFKPLQTDC